MAVQVNREMGESHVFPWLTLYPVLFFRAFQFRIKHTLRHLNLGMKNMSKNYANALFVDDSIRSVSLVPGTASVPNIIQRFTLFGGLSWDTVARAVFGVFLFVGLVWMLLRVGQFEASFLIVDAATFLLTLLLGGVLLYLFGIVSAYVFLIIAFWIRWSVKSTALIWLPLIYLASRAPRSLASATEAIREERASALAALLRLLAWFSLAFFLWRAVVFPSTAEWWLAQEWAAPLLVFILPLGTDAQDLHLWHLASGVSALLTLVTYYMLWERRGRVDVTAAAITPGMTKLYTGYFWTRGVISIYSILCGLWFAYLGVQLIDLPGLSGCVVPWQAGCG